VQAWGVLLSASAHHDQSCGLRRQSLTEWLVGDLRDWSSFGFADEAVHVVVDKVPPPNHTYGDPNRD
jgi:hypothetical protein